MKKEQLKEAVGELNLVDTVFQTDGVSYIDTAVSVTQVYDLIDQLEEPDERTQLEEAYKDILERHIFYYNKTKYQVIKEQIIPRFVADWIDAHDLHGNNPLREYRDLEIDFNEGWTDEKDAAVYHWINKNPYTFIDALRYGYKAEKELKEVTE